jgi:hypothetical protein
LESSSMAAKLPVDRQDVPLSIEKLFVNPFLTAS